MPHESRGRIPNWSTFWLDTKLGLRMLRKHWALTLIGGVAMTAAITLGASMFNFVQAISVTKLPLEEGDRVVILQPWNAASRTPQAASMDDFERWRRGAPIGRGHRRFSQDRTKPHHRCRSGRPHIRRRDERRGVPCSARRAAARPVFHRGRRAGRRAAGGGDRLQRLALALRGRSGGDRAARAVGRNVSHHYGCHASGLRLPGEGRILDSAASHGPRTR